MPGVEMKFWAVVNINQNRIITLFWGCWVNAVTDSNLMEKVGLNQTATGVLNQTLAQWQQTLLVPPDHRWQIFNHS